MMIFSFGPNRPSPRPSMAASVSTRVVSWNDAADNHDSVARDLTWSSITITAREGPKWDTWLTTTRTFVGHHRGL
jgi:hypothetical protein